MKILAHSEVPTNPLPYLHLGYVSAAGWNASMGLVSTVLLLGGGGLAILYKGWKISLLYRTAGLLLICACIPIIILLPSYARGVQANADTRVNASLIFNCIYHRLQDGSQIPDSLRDIEWKGSRPRITDGWKCEYRFHRRDRQDQVVLSLTSAGPDGLFDSTDDMTYHREYSKKLLVKEKP